jgi:nicotinate-nucleotide adenylyltransferase
MTLAILGGTFNPVHLGHLHFAAEVRDRLGYEMILFVPAHIPVHKAMEIEVGPDHRLAMLELAVAPHPEFRVDDCELRRGGASYTIDTVREILDRYPVDGKPGLLLGDDLVAGFGRWKHAPLLAGMVRLIIGHRDSAQEVQIGYPSVYLENSPLPISSSAIRERLRRGESIRDLVPEPVLRYILRHELYT